MSSSFVYQLRKYSGDPLAQRFKLLSEKLAAFEAQTVQIQTGDMKNAVRVTNSINQYKELAVANTVSTFPTPPVYKLPFEPDLKFLTCWYRFNAWGKVVRDSSFQGNAGVILGQAPTAGIGPNKGYGSTIAMEFDGSSQAVEIPDNANIRLVGQVTGFSVAVLINPSTFALTPGGEQRYIVEKTDNPPTSLWALLFGTDGKVHFNVKKAGTDFSKVTTTGTVSLNAWTWIVATWNTSTNTAVIYINGVSQALSADSITDTDFTNVKTNMYVGGTAANDGFFDGDMADFRYYREKILTQAEVTNLNTNMITTSTIALGSVAIAGQSLLSP